MEKYLFEDTPEVTTCRNVKYFILNKKCGVLPNRPHISPFMWSKKLLWFTLIATRSELVWILKSAPCLCHLLYEYSKAMITHQIHATLHISHHFDEYQHVDGRLHKNYSGEKENTPQMWTFIQIAFCGEDLSVTIFGNQCLLYGTLSNVDLLVRLRNDSANCTQNPARQFMAWCNILVMLHSIDLCHHLYGYCFHLFVPPIYNSSHRDYRLSFSKHLILGFIPCLSWDEN